MSFKYVTKIEPLEENFKETANLFKNNDFLSGIVYYDEKKANKIVGGFKKIFDTQTILLYQFPFLDYENGLMYYATQTTGSMDGESGRYDGRIVYPRKIPGANITNSPEIIDIIENRTPNYRRTNLIIYIIRQEIIKMSEQFS